MQEKYKSVKDQEEKFKVKPENYCSERRKHQENKLHQIEHHQEL
jgi:hypothetical protein